ncbi:MAG: beta-ketoacyl-ACP synthase II [Eubacteriales bacterium]|nr:beta-ketoacyl-ACP synthase II [Eubacteriales bacterium]
MINQTESYNRRVVVTGIGAVTPVGSQPEQIWRNITSGVCGITAIEPGDDTIPVHVAGRVTDFDPRDYMEYREARRMDRYCQFAVAAAAMAAEQSRFDQSGCDPWRVGTIIGSGIGGLETMSAEFRKLYGPEGAARITPLFIPMMISNMAAGKVSMAHGAKGTSLCISTACASGTHAIGEAFRAIRGGQLDMCFAGGAEAPITPIAMAGFANMKALTSATDPAAASIPFDRRRSGFVIAEGAAVLMLESLEHAEKRGAAIICEIAGYGSTADAYHITSPDPTGEGPAMAMRLAMKEAGLAPEAIGYINAHGTSTPLNDRYETLAIHQAMGDSALAIPVSSSKSMLGHMLGAAGAAEAMITAFALRDGLLPPTIGLSEQDPDCDLDYVPGQARPAAVKAALSNSLGFGGHNGSLCLKKWEV